MAHGSSVTMIVHPSNRDFCRRSVALRIATISACAVGSFLASRSLQPRPITIPSLLITIAPTGTSSVLGAAAASAKAAFINSSGVGNEISMTPKLQ